MSKKDGVEAGEESILFSNKKHKAGPDWCGSVGWALSCKPKSCQFNYQSGHMPE